MYKQIVSEKMSEKEKTECKYNLNWERTKKPEKLKTQGDNIYTEG